MKNVPIHKCYIQDGKITWFDEDRLDRWIQKLEGTVDVIYKPETKRRSTNQNRFYWAYLRIIEDETGNDSTDLHEYFKRIFLPPRYITVMGKTIKVPSSTTDLDTADFSRYMEKINAETGIPIPDPNEYYVV